MMKLKSKRFCRSKSKLGGDNGGANNVGGGAEKSSGKIKWELRSGGMLV